MVMVILCDDSVLVSVVLVGSNLTLQGKVELPPAVREHPRGPLRSAG